MAASKEFVAKQRRRRMSQPGTRSRNILRALSIWCIDAQVKWDVLHRNEQSSS